jgi:hypothetical protein
MMDSRRMRWEGHVALIGEINASKILFGKSERKRPFGIM